MDLQAATDRSFWHVPPQGEAENDDPEVLWPVAAARVLTEPASRCGRSRETSALEVRGAFIWQPPLILASGPPR